MFKKATKQNLPLKAALLGPAGSGKSYSALAIMRGMVGDGKIAAIDTEHGSLSKYSDAFDFDVLAPTSFAPSMFIGAMQDAAENGYTGVIIDSLSHAWMGKGGILEFKDQVTAKSRSGNSFDAWRTVTPEHNKLVEALLACPVHLIVTMRTKTEYVVETNERGKNVPRKIGLQPVQRDGLEYEFDVIADMDGGVMTVSKSRCPALDGQQYRHPGADVAKVLRGWLGDGPPATPPADPMIAKFRMVCETAGLDPKAEAQALVQSHGVTAWAKLMPTQIEARCREIETPAATQAPAQVPAAATAGEDW